jgi:hypothetical protein
MHNVGRRRKRDREKNANRKGQIEMIDSLAIFSCCRE